MLPSVFELSRFLEISCRLQISFLSNVLFFMKRIMIINDLEKSPFGVFLTFWRLTFDLFITLSVFLLSTVQFSSLLGACWCESNAKLSHWICIKLNFSFWSAMLYCTRNELWRCFLKSSNTIFCYLECEFLMLESKKAMNLPAGDLVENSNHCFLCLLSIFVSGTDENAKKTLKIMARISNTISYR